MRFLLDVCSRNNFIQLRYFAVAFRKSFSREKNWKIFLRNGGPTFRDTSGNGATLTGVTNEFEVIKFV